MEPEPPRHAAPYHLAPLAPPPPPKRRRTQPPHPIPQTADAEMLDVNTPPSTARRLTLQDLPLEAVKQILRHLHPLPPHLHRAGPPVTTLPFLRRYARLRELCLLLRDAFDLHVTALDLSEATPANLFPFLAHTMPRYTALSSLTLPAPALLDSLANAWTRFFAASRARLTHLTYVKATADGTLAAVFARGVATTLEVASTTSAELVDRLAAARAPVHTLELLMDPVDPDLLPLFPGLRALKLLYRAPLTATGAARLVAALRRCQPALHAVELRLNRVSTSALSFAPAVPRLRKLSLFDGVACGAGDRGMAAVARCAFLEEVQLEWVKGLSGGDVARLARGMGGRLRRLRIWNCEDVTDDGLEVLARECPSVEVELTFEREQFRAQTLALFGERVSWGSYAM